MAKTLKEFLPLFEKQCEQYEREANAQIWKHSGVTRWEARFAWDAVCAMMNRLRRFVKEAAEAEGVDDDTRNAK